MGRVESLEGHQKYEEREQPAHLVVVECTTHVLASDALHEHHFFVGLYHLYNLWCATRDLLLAARPAKSQATSQVTSYFWRPATDCAISSDAFDGFTCISR